MSAAVLQAQASAPAGQVELAGLLARVREDDSEALGELYERCRPALVRYLAAHMDYASGAEVEAGWGAGWAGADMVSAGVHGGVGWV